MWQNIFSSIFEDVWVRELALAAIVSTLVWLVLLVWRSRLDVTLLNSAPLYTFMIAIDLLFMFKQPVLSGPTITVPISGKSSMYLFLILAICAMMGAFLGVWLDSKAERALESLPDGHFDIKVGLIGTVWNTISQSFTGRTVDGPTGTATIAAIGRWGLWRSVHSVLQFALTVPHTRYYFWCLA
jgi:hypothetical protein